MEYNGVFAETVTRGHYPVRMCGVLHFGRNEMYPLPEQFEEAYRMSPCIAFETDMDAIASSSFNGRMRTMGSFSAGESLSDVLGSETYSELLEIAEGLGFTEDGISSFRPWYCASLLTNAALQREGLASVLGIDAHLHGRAKIDGKEILALEPPEAQLEILPLMENGDTDRFMRGVVEELRTTGVFSQTLFESWRDGNLEELERLVNGNFSDCPEQRSMVLGERNRRWAEVLYRKSLEKPVLAVVGAGHLVGDGSLQELLSAF